MNEYSVTVLVDASRNYTIKAESPEAAIERAEELHNRESSGLCHHCSGKLDVGGAVGAIAYCEDKEVLDTSYQASRIATLEAECERLRKEKSARQALSIQLIDEARAGRAELAAIKGQGLRADPVKAQLLEALEAMCDAFMILLRTGHDRIIDLGGTCDSVSLMAEQSGDLRIARAAIAAARKEGGEV